MRHPSLFPKGVEPRRSKALVRREMSDFRLCILEHRRMAEPVYDRTRAQEDARYVL